MSFVSKRYEKTDDLNVSKPSEFNIQEEKGEENMENEINKKNTYLGLFDANNLYGERWDIKL